MTATCLSSPSLGPPGCGLPPARGRPRAAGQLRRYEVHSTRLAPPQARPGLVALGLKATELTAVSVPVSSVPVIRWLARSQTVAVPSALPLSSWLPSDLKATDCAFDFPSGFGLAKLPTPVPEARSHSETVPSELTLAS